MNLLTYFVCNFFLEKKEEDKNEREIEIKASRFSFTLVHTFYCNRDFLFKYFRFLQLLLHDS